MTDTPFRDIGACVFDAYGTLFDVHSAVGRAGGALGDKAAAASDVWRVKQLQYTWLRSLMGAYVDFWQVTGEALDYALEAHGVDDPALRQALLDAYLGLDPYPEVADVLGRLRGAGLKTAILSNGAPPMLASAVDSAGLTNLLDDVISVQEVGIFKPDPRVYRLAETHLGLPAGRMVFVSSNAWDAHAAAHFGFQVAWVNRFGQAPERLPGKPKIEIKTLEPLPGRIAAA